MRIKAIMVGAIAALALAALTASASTTATSRASGSLVSLVTATTTIATVADRDDSIAAKRSAESEKSEPAVKPIVAVKPVTPRIPQPSAACQQAIDALKALHQADIAEDAKERAALQPLSAATIAADRAEDLAEVQPWTKALMTARTACLPQPSAACQAALASLKALLPANRPEEWIDMVRLPTPIDLNALRAAFAAVAAACGDRD